ncbi:unnamed protein product [Camellia sinensis]
MALCGVTAMDDFLIKFFPKVHQRKRHAKEDNYGKYDDQLLQLFTSSLYLAALVASFGASKACRIFGRKPTILVASLFFIGGAGFSALAEHKWMLILGRILFGIGVGFGNEVSCSSVLIRDSTSPTQRGSQHSLPTICHNWNSYSWHSQLFHFHPPPNWMEGLLSHSRHSRPCPFLRSMILTETPASLIERGKDTKGKAALKKIRGVDNVEDEYEEVKRTCEIAKEVNQPFKKLMKCSSVPPLVIGIMLQIF